MESTEVTVTCGVNVKWTDSVGQQTRSVVHKIATLRLQRNSLQELFLEISAQKTIPLKLKLSNIAVHKNFMAEGKASVNFKSERCTLFISNAPPGSLVEFLKVMYVKLTGDKGTDEKATAKNLRAHLLSGKPTQFEDVSPVTNTEMVRAARKAGVLKPSSLSTPSPPVNRKRKAGENLNNLVTKAPAAKKLYASPTSSLKLSQEILNEEQNMILQSCLKGRNVFFTGSAGTGKSFLLRKIISALPPDETMATASTGVAACLIGGVTLHSFAGIGDGSATVKRCCELATRPSSSQSWRKCKRLIVDEISMVDGEFFEKIESVARYMKNNDKPFGGIQLILCGDFLQLPPVRKQTQSQDASAKRFCFQSEAWQKCIELSFELQKVHRQKDPEFVRILNFIRIGHVNEEITKRLLETASQRIEKNGILATQLCSLTATADQINESKLNALTGEEKLFEAIDSHPAMSKQLDTMVQVAGKITLKVGSQVMLLKNINISDGLVNGARGIIVKYVNGQPLVRFKSNKEYLAKPEKWIIKLPTGIQVTRCQVPLKLAWAFSIHKSQGLTLDCVEMALSNIFEAGQAYVALSRAQSLEGLRVLDFNPRQVRANPDVLQYYQKLRKRLRDFGPQVYIPLGDKNRKKNSDDVKRLPKSLMSKPLVNIS